jgi:hypothetical protein
MYSHDELVDAFRTGIMTGWILGVAVCLFLTWLQG